MTLTTQTLMDALAGVAYAIDQDGTITAVGRRGWRLFAVDSGAVDLADSQSVVGRNLFDFLTGEEVRTAYARILERLRKGEPQVTLPCRCDAPGIVREMRMTVTPLKRTRSLHGFLFQSIALAERTRPPIRLYEFAQQSHPQTAPLLGMCSLCERVCPPGADCSDPAAPWMEAESYYAGGGSSHVNISHTVCSGCFRQWVQGWTGRPPPDF